MSAWIACVSQNVKTVGVRWQSVPHTLRHQHRLKSAKGVVDSFKFEHSRSNHSLVRAGRLRNHILAPQARGASFLFAPLASHPCLYSIVSSEEAE